MEGGTLVWVRDPGPEAWLAGTVLSRVSMAMIRAVLWLVNLWCISNNEEWRSDDGA